MPGPGAHATERSFVNPDENEFDAKKCIEEQLSMGLEIDAWKHAGPGSKKIAWGQ